MRTVFADTFYWIALANPADEWHSALKSLHQSLGPVKLVTTDEVLDEFLTYYAAGGQHWRAKVANLVRMILDDPNTKVVQQSRATFDRALRLYETRLDKEYSLTDCGSMETMRILGLTEVLSHDHHFTQEGFRILVTDRI